MQVDVSKPLISTIVIEGLHQPVIYEGLNLLCFSCGRVGHKKGGCPYIVRTPSPVKADGTKVAPEVEVDRT